MKKEEILNELKEIKSIYEKEGLEMIEIFSSYSKHYKKDSLKMKVFDI